MKRWTFKVVGGVIYPRGASFIIEATQLHTALSRLGLKLRLTPRQAGLSPITIILEGVQP